MGWGIETKNTLKILIPYPSVTGNKMWRHVGGKKKVILSELAKEYQTQIAYTVREQGAMYQIDQEMEVVFRVYIPDKRCRDMSNVLKIVEDGLTKAGVWKDDFLITRMMIIDRRPASDRPRIEILINSIDYKTVT